MSIRRYTIARAAGRLYWVYGPGKAEITIIDPEPHPEDQKKSKYATVNLSPPSTLVKPQIPQTVVSKYYIPRIAFFLLGASVFAGMLLAQQSSSCFLDPDPGPCKAHFIKYYFDQDEQRCKSFVWGGCEGVVPFHTLEECKASCEKDTPIVLVNTELIDIVWNLEAYGPTGNMTAVSPPGAYALLFRNPIYCKTNLFAKADCNTCQGWYSLRSNDSISMTLGCTKAGCGTVPGYMNSCTKGHALPIKP